MAANDLIVFVLLLACFTSDGTGAPALPRGLTVQLFPAYAWRNAESGAWEAEISGWVYREGRRKKLVEKLVDAMTDEDDEDNDEEQADSNAENLNDGKAAERAGLFAVDSRSNQRLVLDVAGVLVETPPTDSDGQFAVHIKLEAAQVNASERQDDSSVRIIRFRVLTGPSDRREFTGKIRLIPDEGVSVVSDIDDTIRISEIHDRSEMLERTFLKPFEAVSGMSEAYSRWAGSLDAEFHYVSGAPTELYPAIARFIEKEAFPPGTIHLRPFKLLGGAPLDHKLDQISLLASRFPRRQFVLVGDSGEQDPEIYGEVARRFPDRIARILIRNVGRDTAKDARLAKAFSGVPGHKWLVFRRASELPKSIR